MIRWIKYKLFMWLWDDICLKSKCDNCMLDDKGCSCFEMEIRLVNQAKSAWKVK